MTEFGKVDYHPNRLRIMYVVNVVLAGGLGIGYIIAPSAMASILGHPVETSLWAAGYAYSYMVSLAVLGLLGLRSPLKFSMTLLMQAIAKIIWIVAIILPLMLSGDLPYWTLMFTAIFAVWAAANIVVVPWRYFLSK